MNLGALFSDNPQVVVPGWFLKMTGWFLQIYYFILLVLEVKILEKTLYFGKRIKKKKYYNQKKIFPSNQKKNITTIKKNIPAKLIVPLTIFYGFPQFSMVLLQFSMAFINFPTCFL